MNHSDQLPYFNLPCCYDSFVRPMQFSHLLQSGQDQELTYITLTACIDPQEQQLCLYLTCFETNPLPEYYFEIELATASSPLALCFSSSHATLPHPNITLNRDGGENLEGTFWGALLKIPLSLLPEKEIPVQIRYTRSGTVSSPFPQGQAVWLIASKK